MRNRLGILGGGQLALMLADAAAKMGLRPLILAENKGCPAALAHPNVMMGSMKNPQVLQEFLYQVEVVIFENEFVDCQGLAHSTQTQFVPSLVALQLFQDKLKQKQLFQDTQIPSPEYIEVTDCKSELELKEVSRCLGGECVLKWSRMGYDGHGVLFFKSFNSSVEYFFAQAKLNGSRIYAEKKVNFRRELAILSVVGIGKESPFLTYPLVISEQENGICSRVYGPAVAMGVASRLEDLARVYAQKIAQTAGLTGAFAVEFFETEQGELWVNEVAPRVHNSGHYTQNACTTDQFENHIRAALGLPLGKITASPGFAMLNILGPEGLVSKKSSLPSPGPWTHIHWYGKEEIRPRRKLGHLNGTVDSVEEITPLLKELELCKENWVKQQTLLL